MYKRNHYLDLLMKFKDKEPIKVITGVRRSGKSKLMELYADKLLSLGVPKDNIIQINLERIEFDYIRTYADLQGYIETVKQEGGINYYLIDEIQNVDKWEKVINSLRLEKNSDIYLTGSNAHMLSSELATHIAGRYIEIKMYPLSFAEYYKESKDDKEATFFNYIEEGGFPRLYEYGDDKEAKAIYLDGILNTILLKDIITRGAVRDVDLMEKLLKYLANNSGSIFSTQKIANYLTSIGRKTPASTIDNYVSLIEKSFAVAKVSRYDIKGKELMKTLGKFYFVDTGIKNILRGRSGVDYGMDLESIVYYELVRRNRKVSVGKLGNMEIDFVTENENGIAYYQVSASIMDDNTRERELKPLKAINDNYPKYVLTMDRLPYGNFDGIQQVNIVEFLLGE